MEKLKSYFKRLGNALWDSTDLDEKAEAALKEAITKEIKNILSEKKR